MLGCDRHCSRIDFICYQQTRLLPRVIHIRLQSRRAAVDSARLSSREPLLAARGLADRAFRIGQTRRRTAMQKGEKRRTKREERTTKSCTGAPIRRSGVRVCARRARVAQMREENGSACYSTFSTRRALYSSRHTPDSRAACIFRIDAQDASARVYCKTAKIERSSTRVRGCERLCLACSPVYGMRGCNICAALDFII